MKGSIKQKPTDAGEEAKERDAKIKAMLANIPCMSRETLAENRRKIE